MARRGKKRSHHPAESPDVPTKPEAATPPKRPCPPPTPPPQSSIPHTNPIPTNTMASDAPPQLDFASPKTLFQSLLHPVDFAHFFDQHWEKSPLVVKGSRTAGWPDLFSKQILEDLLRRHSVQFGRDLNACRYHSGRVEDVGAPPGSGPRLTPERFQRLYQDGVTVQFFQPQRFQEGLWRVMENLESFFGCLVGCNVYLTPGGTQGFAPHYDDVEVFVLQLEGAKRWRLYRPPLELPRGYSRDLRPEEIGEPTHDVVIEKGDLLYFPRGTVHQAETPQGMRHSTHVTISTYQHNSWGDYITSVFPHLMTEAMKVDVDFRRGLPINFIKSTKLAKTDKVQSVIGILLDKLVKLRTQKFLAPASMVEGFMSSRLPPFGVDGKSLQETVPEGPSPTLSSQIRLKHPEHVCWFLKPKAIGGTEDDSDDECPGPPTPPPGPHRSVLHQSTSESTDSDEEILFVYSSLYNDRLTHMMGGCKDDESAPSPPLRFPKQYLDAMEQLRATCDQFSPVSTLPLGTDGDRETLVTTLWNCHLLEVEPARGKLAQAGT